MNNMINDLPPKFEAGHALEDHRENDSMMIRIARFMGATAGSLAHLVAEFASRSPKVPGINSWDADGISRRHPRG